MSNALLLDLYELTMASSYSTYRSNAHATFDLFIRQLPPQRSYLVSCGLEDILAYIRDLKFSQNDISYLKSLDLFGDDFLRYLRRFSFRGDLWAIPEGEIFFAQEPVVRVTAPLIQAQIMESFLLNTINLQTMIASKASRVVCAASGKALFDFALRRTHGAEAGLKVARASYIAGFDGTSCVLAGKQYKIPVAGTMAHSFVMSFKEEMDSFLAYSETFPKKTILLVDTYDTKKGIENAVKAGLYLKERGAKLLGIRLDSGDLLRLSKIARHLLDTAGLGYAKIFASGNLDEFKINNLRAQGAAIDCFGVGTNMGTSIDAPCLDVIYKLSEVTDEQGNFLPTMKLSAKKLTYPGRKQIFRIKDKNGKCLKDILGLEREAIKGVPLLKKVVSKGKIIYKNPSLPDIRKKLKKSLANFSNRLTGIDTAYVYPVEESPALRGLRLSLARQLRARQ